MTNIEASGRDAIDGHIVHIHGGIAYSADFAGICIGCHAELTCTGLTATWCPIHGDCACPGRVPLDDRGCLLHSPGSPHGELPERLGGPHAG